jgi:predicted transposase YdaD
MKRGDHRFAMAGVWDTIMKRLVKRYAQHYVSWLAPEAEFIQALDGELQQQTLYADALMEVQRRGRRGLIHIEFQSYEDADMAARLLRYNMLAEQQYELPVYSYVIYLRRKGKVAQSPLERRFIDERVVHLFYFQTIKLWEVPAQLLLQTGWLGVLPLVVLAQEGKQLNIVQQTIDQLAAEQEYDLLAMMEILGGLLFTKGSPDYEAFKRRFRMFQDLLSESPIYQEIFGEGEEKGRQEGALQAQAEMLLNIVKLRFPELQELAKQQVDTIKDVSLLSAINLNLVIAQTTEEARQALLSAGRNGTSH